MKTLLLARHAKSGWDQAKDFDRTLSDRGESDVKNMAEYLSECGYVVHQIITSDAVRAQTTAEEYQRQLAPKNHLITHHDLYNASQHDILNIARNIAHQESTVMLVGHNPGMHEVLNYLARGKVSDMPSCSVAIIQFETDHWKDISDSNGALLAFEYPNKM